MERPRCVTTPAGAVVDAIDGVCPGRFQCCRLQGRRGPPKPTAASRGVAGPASQPLGPASQ
eukprot:10665551-Lingulodinium_polyedra.AAC.1